MTQVFEWVIVLGIVIAVAAMIANAKHGYRTICPYCKTSMNLGATVCKKCGRDVPRKQA